ncbi:hypothetical protein V2J09_005877 [Rumex salicifolius]
MGEKGIANSRYEYVHEKGNWPTDQIDIHHVKVLRGTPFKRVLYIDFVLQYLEDLDIFMIGYLLIAVMLIRLLIRKQVVKESVLILPGFGVQLETHYKSGKVSRRFVPIDKILRPVLNECVTPVTCYWSLALLLHEENELMLVFKELHPTLEMMIPIWKALCTGIDPK